MVGCIFTGVFFAIGASNFAIGFFGVSKKNNTLLFSYSITIWGLFAGFFILFAFFFNKKVWFENNVINYCRNHISDKFMDSLQKAYPGYLPTTFCSENCQCASDPTRFPRTVEYSSAIFNNSGAKNLLQCPNNVYNDEPKREVFGLLETLELRYECSGVCSREKWFYFSDVNQGAPLYSCQLGILNYINEKFILIYGLIMTSGLVMFFAPIPTVVLMCIRLKGEITDY